MPRYIDADALIAEYDRVHVGAPGGARKLMVDAPTADVVPKVIGKWKPYKDYFTRRQIGWICSNCSAVTKDLSNGDTDFCPHCGAIMEGE